MERVEIVTKGNATQFKILNMDSSGNVISTEEFDIEVAIVKDNAVSPKPYYLHYLVSGINRTVNQDAWEFINVFLMNRSENTRKIFVYELRYLLAFLHMNHRSLADWRRTDIEAYKNFLQGNCFTMHSTNYRFRENSTINRHLATLRLYTKFLGIRNPILLDSKTIGRVSGITDSPLDFTMNKYNYSVRTNRTIQQCPKFISAEEFLALEKLAIDKCDLQMRIIMTLGWHYGLRMGEVLGLTLEDITDAWLQTDYQHIIILRNRISDKDFQYCKNMYHPNNPEEYENSRAYQLEWEKATMAISENTFQLIMEYINAVHSRIAIKKYTGYDKSIADIVKPKDFEMKENHYLFINSLGHRLSGQLLGKQLKQYFSEVGLQIDSLKREANLFHRFRAGFCTYSIHILKLPELEVARMMRHKTLNSLSAYFRLTPEQELKLKTELEAYINQVHLGEK